MNIMQFTTKEMQHIRIGLISRKNSIHNTSEEAKEIRDLLSRFYDKVGHPDVRDVLKLVETSTIIKGQ